MEPADDRACRHRCSNRNCDHQTDILEACLRCVCCLELVCRESLRWLCRTELRADVDKRVAALPSTDHAAIRDDAIVGVCAHCVGPATGRSRA